MTFNWLVFILLPFSGSFNLLLPLFLNFLKYPRFLFFCCFIRDFMKVELTFHTDPSLYDSSRFTPLKWLSAWQPVTLLGWLAPGLLTHSCQHLSCKREGVGWRANFCKSWHKRSLFFKFIYFIYLFLAVLGLCCCAWAVSSCGKRGILFVAEPGSRSSNFSSCDTWHVGSSQTRDQTHVPCIGRRILNHCATREIPEITF